MSPFRDNDSTESIANFAKRRKWPSGSGAHLCCHWPRTPCLFCPRRAPSLPPTAIRTGDFLYVHNFAPDRWPMGDPKGLDDPDAPAPDFAALRDHTYTAYPDLDASPTKAWMIHHRAEADVQPLFDLGFGKRPREELYDLRVDPDYMHNLAQDPNYDAIREELATQLMGVLQAQDDPRVVEVPCRFEDAPYAGPTAVE
ncbi:MAG: hypothetical protein R2932_41750 [Caldilineaceae bacterium]